MQSCIAVVAATLGGVLLLSCLTWNYLGYEYIANRVTIEQVAGMRFDYIIGLCILITNNTNIGCSLGEDQYNISF